MTIIDIARLSGVSKSTVSRVLSGAESVSEDAREKVMAAVQTSGFRRNDLARSLRSGRTGMIGLVIPDIANPFWADVARGAQDAAADENVSLLIFNSDWDPERERRHLLALTQSRVDGAIVNPVRDGLDEIARFRIPLVLIGSSAERFPQLPSVGSDISQGVSIGLDRIVAAGLGMPALLVGDAERTARERFVAAVRSIGEVEGWPLDEMRLEDGHYTVDGGRAAMNRLLARDIPRVVFAANDLMALGALQAIRSSGLRCPEDVALLGFDGVPAAEVSAPSLTTVAKPSREIGGRAFELLSKKIAGEPDVPKLSLPCALIERETLPQPNYPRAVSTG
ncbi:LacI family DNA-binding transcriptional regulator [Histidinibacterium aquaticum]|uniref:LacI family DNA-binding transcriptional regulator n=1 Tax=Histidinibacterium aquaticum TaxID=2613962 RepID=UPI001CC4B3B4|nr:LacI family DNA-binding transcriptional regulator [Histidinibacterium aquaticum]